jgi:hypothetical protein
MFLAHLRDMIGPGLPKLVPNLDDLRGGWEHGPLAAWTAHDSAHGIGQVPIHSPKPAVHCVQMACLGHNVEQDPDLMVSQRGSKPAARAVG